MKEITLEFVVTYSFYTFFLFYPTKWMRDFRGASQKVYIFLVCFSGVGTIVKLIILGLIWYQIDFQNAFGVFIISFISSIILTYVELLITRKLFNFFYPVEYVGLVSLILCPILAVRLLYLLKVI